MFTRISNKWSNKTPRWLAVPGPTELYSLVPDGSPTSPSANQQNDDVWEKYTAQHDRIITLNVSSIARKTSRFLRSTRLRFILAVFFALGLLVTAIVVPTVKIKHKQIREEIASRGPIYGVKGTNNGWPLWEDFKFKNGYYGGKKDLKKIPYKPYGDRVACDGPVADMDVYEGVPDGMPEPVFNSYDVMGLDSGICYEREALLKPYGFDERKLIANWTTNWGRLQSDCAWRNEERLESRTAVVFRAWDTYIWRADDIINLRRMITELSLKTGGEYSVFLLIQVKDLHHPIWADPSVYERIKRESVPEEFWEIAILWNEALNGFWYSATGIYDVYRSLQMPLQHFSKQHPEFDYIWNWEMDVRYIGNHFHFFDKIVQWTKKQPRKGLWERSGRHYIPSVHGTWDEFAKNITPSVYGPVRPNNTLHSYASDLDVPVSRNPKWGIGEEADLITFLPYFDPNMTTWNLRDDCYGFEQHIATVPRRSAIVTVSRMSKRLLNVMHVENSYGRTCASEMWPATAAYHHGLKAVNAPHPMYLDREWEPEFVDQVFNAGKDGQAGGAEMGVYGAPEHNFKGSTWYFNAAFPRNLYRRWLGYAVSSEGGEEYDKEHGNMCLPSMLLHPIKDIREVEVEIEDRRIAQEEKEKEEREEEAE